MGFLLDTHILIWSVAASYRLPREMAETIESTEHSVYFSVISIWELVIKAGLPRRILRVDAQLTRREALLYGFQELPVTAVHAFAVGTLPHHHKDPFDRMLIAQAPAEGLELLTMDAQVQRYSPEAAALLLQSFRGASRYALIMIFGCPAVTSGCTV